MLFACDAQQVLAAASVLAGDARCGASAPENARLGTHSDQTSRVTNIVIVFRTPRGRVLEARQSEILSV